MSEDWEARAYRAEALLREVIEFCDDVFENPAAHVPPWERGASTVEGRHATREQHLAARIWRQQAAPPETPQEQMERELRPSPHRMRPQPPSALQPGRREG